MSQKTPNSPTPLPPHTVVLDEPIIRGEQTIAQVSLRKPASGEFRGVALGDVMRLDVASLHTVLPRITSPSLTAHEVKQSDLCDLTALGAELLSFFETKAERALRSPAG